MRRVVTLPSHGRLIVATDLQGHVEDYERVEAIFEASAAREPTTLVITGDLVHGPEIAQENWPDYLGSFYEGDSKTVLAKAEALQRRHPDRVHFLMGNHEHAHIGGPVVSKFFPDEAAHLEDDLGTRRTAEVRAWFRSWPFVAVAPAAGIVLSHAAPHAEIESPEDLETLDLESFREVEPGDFSAFQTLGALLWARTTSTERAHRFLRALHPEATVSVFGHDVARTGYAIDREPLLCVSSSFGCFEGDKLYLSWDLAERALSASDVARRGLRQVYPDARPVFRSSGHIELAG